MTGPDTDYAYILINLFTPVKGGIEALAAFQLEEMRDMEPRPQLTAGSATTSFGPRTALH